MKQSPAMGQCIAFELAAMGRYTHEFCSYIELPNCCLARAVWLDIVSLRVFVNGLVRRPGQVLRVGRTQALYVMHQIPSLCGAD